MTYTRLHNVHQITHPVPDHTICKISHDLYQIVQSTPVHTPRNRSHNLYHNIQFVPYHKIRSTIKQSFLNHIIRNRSHNPYQTKQSVEDHIIRTRPDHTCRRQEKNFSGNEHFTKPHSTCLKTTKILNLKPTKFCTGNVSACAHAVNQLCKSRTEVNLPKSEHRYIQVFILSLTVTRPSPKFPLPHPCHKIMILPI
jgi:hypothetical protein